jgi:nitroimidazol reductase NimA-like FMN-containing flavoprotein (pyridoxamine 5'-phosphate oxidase superfamily)
MPGYGISESAEGMLPWSWAEERLSDSRNYWVASTRPDGRPHLMPVWAVWVGDALYFSTARTSTKARNLFASPTAASAPSTATRP